MAALGAVANANHSAIKNLINGPDFKANYTVSLCVICNNNLAAKTAKNLLLRQRSLHLETDDLRMQVMVMVNYGLC